MLQNSHIQLPVDYDTIIYIITQVYNETNGCDLHGPMDIGLDLIIYTDSKLPYSRTDITGQYIIRTYIYIIYIMVREEKIAMRDGPVC